MIYVYNIYLQILNNSKSNIYNGKRKRYKNDYKQLYNITNTFLDRTKKIPLPDLPYIQNTCLCLTKITNVYMYIYNFDISYSGK